MSPTTEAIRNRTRVAGISACMCAHSFVRGLHGTKMREAASRTRACEGGAIQICMTQKPRKGSPSLGANQTLNRTRFSWLFLRSATTKGIPKVTTIVMGSPDSGLSMFLLLAGAVCRYVSVSAPSGGFCRGSSCSFFWLRLT